MKKLFLFTLLLIIPLQAIIPQPAIEKEELDEGATVSLLTVFPWDEEVYAIFGHTAIRIQSPAQQLDWVYNYGYFDSSKPNFIYHFVKGETDYVLGVDKYDYFMHKYAVNNSRIDEQILNFSTEEKRNIFNFLNYNALPENKGYRYDYFFDNCSTRPRDIIEKYAGGNVVYTEPQHTTTLRKLVHECTQPYPWLEFGIDLVIGSGADSTVHYRTEMFLPIKLMQAFDAAEVVTDSTSHPLIKEKLTLLDKRSDTTIGNKNTGISLFSPEVVSALVLLIVILFTVFGFRKNRMFRGLDTLLFSTAGIAGCIVCFICFVSTHPCTSWNYNVLWLHPLHLVGAIFFPIKSCKKFTDWYHLINFVVLTIFLATLYFIPQSIPGAAIVLAVCLWMRSGANLNPVKKLLNKKPEVLSSK